MQNDNIIFVMIIIFHYPLINIMLIRIYLFDKEIIARLTTE